MTSQLILPDSSVIFAIKLYFIQIQMSSKLQKNQQLKWTSPEIIFKYTNIILLLILIFCIQGFIKFREYAQSKGYHVFSEDALIWCGIGFIGIFITKYSYFYFMESKIEPIIHSKYSGQDRIYKLKSVLKLTFDSVFYASTTITAYTAFKNQYWFPSIVGGKGSCQKIYSQYPNAPVSGKVDNLELYFMIQLGVHLFSVFEMAVIKRKTQRKFYEYLLHHCVAATLILFSMMSNQTAAGAMILIIHDASDIILALGRAVIQTKYESIIIGAIFYVSQLIIWIYLRIIIFPFCLLANVYINKPTSNDEWYVINFQYGYLLTMAFVLYGMHIFWTFLLIKIGYMAFKSSKKWENISENKQKD